MVGARAEEEKTFSWLLNNHYAHNLKAVCLSCHHYPHVQMWECWVGGVGVDPPPQVSPRDIQSLDGNGARNDTCNDWCPQTNICSLCSIACHFNLYIIWNKTWPLNFIWAWELIVWELLIDIWNKQKAIIISEYNHFQQPKNYLYSLNWEHFEIISVTNNGKNLWQKRFPIYKSGGYTNIQTDVGTISNKFTHFYLISVSDLLVSVCRVRDNVWNILIASYQLSLAFFSYYRKQHDIQSQLKPVNPSLKLKVRFFIIRGVWEKKRADYLNIWDLRRIREKCWIVLWMNTWDLAAKPLKQQVTKIVQDDTLW